MISKEVSFPLAKLLKEKEFDEPCRKAYFLFKKMELLEPKSSIYGENHQFKNSDEHFNMITLSGKEGIGSKYTSPTIAQVIDWLLDKHGIWIEVRFHQSYKIFYFEIININSLKGLTSKGKSHFNLPTEAYEKAIEYTLLNLI
jgi:hypothetical protein